MDGSGQTRHAYPCVRSLRLDMKSGAKGLAIYCFPYLYIYTYRANIVPIQCSQTTSRLFRPLKPLPNHPIDFPRLLPQSPMASLHLLPRQIGYKPLHTFRQTRRQRRIIGRLNVQNRYIDRVLLDSVKRL